MKTEAKFGDPCDGEKTFTPGQGRPPSNVQLVSNL